jgi:hypothetical protein
LYSVVAVSKNVEETLKLVIVLTDVVDIIDVSDIRFDIEVDCVIKEPNNSVVSIDDTKFIVTSGVFLVLIETVSTKFVDCVADKVV